MLPSAGLTSNHVLSISILFPVASPFSATPCRTQVARHDVLDIYLKSRVQRVASFGEGSGDVDPRKSRNARESALS
jgi:hypothetical protein